MARKQTKIDRNLFETAVKNAEKDGALKKLGDLHNAVVKQYTILTIKNDDLPPISAAIVRERLEEWQIETLTTSGKGEKSDLFRIRQTGIVTGINWIIERIPAELTEVLALLDELKTITLDPLEPAVSALPPAEVAPDEEVIDPNAVDVPVPSAEVVDVIFKNAEVTDSELAA
jgi:hypothetical protein